MASEADGGLDARGAALDQDGRLAEDRRCSRCGYNLRGLEPAGNCPECALPVGDSLFCENLRCADRRWLRMVRGGLVLLTAVAGAACAGLFLVVLLLLAALMGIASSLSFVELLIGLAPAIGAGSAVCACFGTLLLTVREPVEPIRRPGWTRRVARSLMWAALALGVAAALYDTRWSVWVPPYQGVSGGLLVAAVLACLAMAMAACWYMEYLLDRGGRRRRDAALLPTAGLFVVGLAFVCLCAGDYLPWVSGRSEGLVMAGVVSLMMGGPVAPVSLLVLVVRTYRAVARACDESADRHGQMPQSR